jgi:hypothetical protein
LHKTWNWLRKDLWKAQLDVIIAPSFPSRPGEYKAIAQNKANFGKTRMNVYAYMTEDSTNYRNRYVPKNKANS